MSAKSRKILILRLSSLGDVVLASSALTALAGKPAEVDWVVAKEFRTILERHPRLHRVWQFDRKDGLEDWRSLAKELWEQGYDEVLDLHSSLRTRILRRWFQSWASKAGRQAPTWRSFSKERLRLYGFFLLKKALPSGTRPKRLVERFALLAGGSGTERPDLRHLVSRVNESWASEPYICVMPGSLWVGKRWPVERFVEVIEQSRLLPVVLGTDHDLESVALVNSLEKKGLRHVSGVGRWDLAKVASVLASSRGYLGNDTGLAHLAEAVGVPVAVIFGPTSPEMGFGPWRSESVSIHTSLWCSPCGKDGRHCWRKLDKYACLREISPERVRREAGFLNSAQSEGGSTSDVGEVREPGVRAGEKT